MSKFATFVHGLKGRRYLLPSGDPFADWSITDRYAHSRHFDSRGRIAASLGSYDVRNGTARAAGRLRVRERFVSFDDMWDRVSRILSNASGALADAGRIYLVRDLLGKVRLSVLEDAGTSETCHAVQAVRSRAFTRRERRAIIPASDRRVDVVAVGATGQEGNLA